MFFSFDAQTPAQVLQQVEKNTNVFLEEVTTARYANLLLLKKEYRHWTFPEMHQWVREDMLTHMMDSVDLLQKKTENWWGRHIQTPEGRPLVSDAFFSVNDNDYKNYQHYLSLARTQTKAGDAKDFMSHYPIES